MNKMSDEEDKVKKEWSSFMLIVVFLTFGVGLYFVGKVLVNYVVSI